MKNLEVVKTASVSANSGLQRHLFGTDDIGQKRKSAVLALESAAAQHDGAHQCRDTSSHLISYGMA